LTDSNLRYTFTCPSCSGSFSIPLESIPPVQARFRCPHCKEPMDFPSREEARVYARLQQPEPAAPPPAPPPAATPTRTDPPKAPAWKPPAPGSLISEASDPATAQRFRIEKQGFENDVFDRRGIRNLIRTGELSEDDFVSVDGAAAMTASQVPVLKSLFTLRATSTVKPPARCRTHTEVLAFYSCKDTARPLCEECAPEKKFGNSTVRVCAHCGGTALELAPVAEA
jgi:predicted Zn finger-like uncharacterized protein